MLSTRLTLPGRPVPETPTRPAAGVPVGSVAARFVGVFCGLFLAGLMLIELHFATSATEIGSGGQVLASGETSIALYGAGQRGHCFVNDAYRAVPQGSLRPGGIGTNRMLRVPVDGVPKRIQCSAGVRMVESRLVPLYALIDSDRPVILAAVGLLVSTYLGWPLWLWRPLEVSRR